MTVDTELASKGARGRLHWFVPQLRARARVFRAAATQRCEASTEPPTLYLPFLHGLQSALDCRESTLAKGIRLASK